MTYRRGEKRLLFEALLVTASGEVRGVHDVKKEQVSKIKLRLVSISSDA